MRTSARNLWGKQVARRARHPYAQQPCQTLQQRLLHAAHELRNTWKIAQAGGWRGWRETQRVNPQLQARGPQKPHAQAGLRRREPTIGAD